MTWNINENSDDPTPHECCKEEMKILKQLLHTYDPVEMKIFLFLLKLRSHALLCYLMCDLMSQRALGFQHVHHGLQRLSRSNRKRLRQLSSGSFKLQIRD